MRRRRRPPRPSASRGRSRSCRTGRSWSPTPHTTRSSSWSRTSRPSAGGGEAPASSTSHRVCSCCRPTTAAEVGYDLLVADSVNHQVKGISLSDNDIRLVAGSGAPLRRREAGGPALEQDLSTPWDLAWWDGRVVVAMAGIHQLWGLTLDPDPARGRLEVLAGTTQEGLRDGPGESAWLAQPSGLATSGDGRRVWVADSETSALRTWSAEGLTTQVGTGLFDFGHRDGPAGEALLQHPLGVVALPDGSVAVCDTYNGAIRRFDPATNRVSTLAGGLAEPSDAVVEWADDGTARLVVVESAAHRLVRVAMPADAQEVVGPARQTQRPPTTIASGPVELVVAFEPPQRPEARRPMGRPDPAGRLGQPARAPSRRRRGRRGPDPSPHRGDRHTRRHPARLGPGRGVRHRRREPGLPPVPAGLGHPGDRRRRRTRPVRVGPARNLNARAMVRSSAHARGTDGGRSMGIGLGVFLIVIGGDSRVSRRWTTRC